MIKPTVTRSRLIWPSLPINVHFRKSSNWKPFPLNQESCRIYSLARHAIWNACKALGLGEGDIVLVPAYHHGSEVEALIEVGLTIRYYEVGDALEPDPVVLESLLDSKTRAFYLIHYLGFPQDGRFWRQWCDQRNLIFIEDAAQAFLATYDGQPVGSFGHMGIFCLYKTYGVPDGGAVVSTIPPPPPSGAAQTGYWRVFKRHVNWMAARREELGLIHLLLKPLVTRWNRTLHKMRGQLTIEFDMGDPFTPPATMTLKLLPRLLDEGTANRRRENYKFLLEHLGEMVPPPFATLPDGACPFAFPLEVKNAREFLQRLRNKGVVGLLFWINPHPSLPVEAFPKSKELREGMLALPVHQELTKLDLEQIIEAVRASSREEPVIPVASVG